MAGDKRFLDLLEEVRAVHVGKAAGYAGSDNPDVWTNFREATLWGSTPLLGCFIRMGDKYRRVQNLRRNPANDQVGESIRDTLMDLASYALIAICLLEEELKLLEEEDKVNIDTKGFELGEEVLDPITGMIGKIIGFTQWFSGCAVATVQPVIDPKEPYKIPDSHGFDVTRLRKVTPATETSQRKTGGPQPNPPTTR